MFKLEKKGTRTRSIIFSKSTINTPKDANFYVLVSLLLTLKLFYTLL